MWMWIDANCFSQQNSMLFNAFRVHNLNVKRFKDFDSFQDELYTLAQPADPISDPY